MYEIWLMANIVWELVLIYRVPLLALALVWVALWMLALRKPRLRNRRAVLGVAALAFLGALFVIPTAMRSSIGEARYAPDWLAVVGAAFAAAIVVALFAAPIRRLAAR